jgi:hypothetical protein
MEALRISIPHLHHNSGGTGPAFFQIVEKCKRTLDIEVQGRGERAYYQHFSPKINYHVITSGLGWGFHTLVRRGFVPRQY